MARREKESAVSLNWEDVPEIPKEEQPYPLPEGWKWVQLKKVIKLISGRDVPKSFCNDNEKGIPYILGASNLKNNIFTIERWIKEPVVVSKKDDLLISVKGTVGELYIQREDIINISRQIMACRTYPLLYNRFLYFYLVSISNDLQQYANGLIPGISRELILNYPCPLPEYSKQQRIATRIESLFAKLDEAKEQAEAVLDGFETRKASILHKAFSGELTEKWRFEHGHKKEEWQSLTLNDVAKWGSGGTPSRKHLEYYAGDIPWVKTGELNNEYLYETEEHITKDAIKNSSAKIFPKETVIIAMYGATIGQCAILGIDAATNQACACAIVKQNTYNKFLFNYLISQKNNFINLGKGGAQPNISQAIIKEYPIFLPSLPEQQEIVSILDTLLSKEQQTKDAAETVLEEIELMKKSILARAFRGELCWQ